MITNHDQVSRVLEPAPDEPHSFDDGITPLMPFPTSYVLNRDQENELVDFALKRLDELELESGRKYCINGNWWNGEGISAGSALGTDGPETTWMGKRLLFDKTFKNEMDWRPGLLGGIYTDSNLVVPAARRICRQMIARAVNYFFGTSPWFSLYAVGALDKARADKGDRYARWKMDRAKLQRTLEQGIERAFIVGEAVIKTTWQERGQIHKTRATVLVDEAGLDILGADGDYILQSDLWIQDATVDEAGNPIVSDLVVLKRDGKTPQPDVLIWQEKLITRRITHYKGPEAKVIHFMDFLCPLEAPSIQEADCVVHLYDMPIMVLADHWKENAAASATAEERVEATRKASELLRRLSSGTNERSPNAQNSDAVDSSTKIGTRDNRLQPSVKVAEFNLTYDIDGDGLRNITLIVDRESRVPIFYDYDANVTEDGLRPYSCERVNEIPGRWYGMGAMEMMNPSQQIIDLWMNRKNRAVSGAGRVDLWSPHNTKEGQANPNLEMNWGGSYTPINNGTKPEEILQSIYLQDNIGDKLMELIEFVMQLMMNESGIANANDGNVSGMDSTKLATGIRNIEKSGQELFSLFLGHLEPGITECLTKMVKILFGHLDEIEVYRYFETGESKVDPQTGMVIQGEGAEGMMQIDPGEIAQLEIDVQILLTRYRGEQVVESNLNAVKVALQYFDPAISPEVQGRLAPLFIDVLKAYQVGNADQIIRPLVQAPMAGPAGQPINPAAAAAGVTGPQRRGADNL